jgi:hypothetical protein
MERNMTFLRQFHRGATAPTKWSVLMLFLAMFVGAVAASRTAHGLIVMNIDPTPNYSAPTAQTSGFAVNPDPGWGNITARGVYLGNQWVIAPYHTTGGSLPATETLDSGTYKVVPGSLVVLENTIVDNTGPNGIPDGKDDTTGVSRYTDLIMYRIDTQQRYGGTPEELGGPSLRSISLPTTSAPNNSQLMIMGIGRARIQHTLYHWTGTISNGSISWSGETPCSQRPDCFDPAPNGGVRAVGYRNPQSGDPEVKAWGTNRTEVITNNNFPDNPNDATDVIVIPGSASRAVRSGAGHTFMQMMDFDEYSFTIDGLGNIIGGGNEAQGTGGDSGSAVFRRNGDLWELTGLVHSIGNYIHTARSVAIRQDNGSQADIALGDVTLFSDLSKYSAQITALLADTNYSILGDINLDGQVSGDGTGTWETDDVTALIQGWGYRHAGAPDILSWKHGDLNRDGVTDLADFVVLRSALGPSGANLNLAGLLGSVPSAVIPEPASLALLGLGMVALCAWRRTRRALP